MSRVSVLFRGASTRSNYVRCRRVKNNCEKVNFDGKFVQEGHLDRELVANVLLLAGSVLVDVLLCLSAFCQPVSPSVSVSPLLEKSVIGKYGCLSAQHVCLLNWLCAAITL